MISARLLKLIALTIFLASAGIPLRAQGVSIAASGGPSQASPPLRKIHGTVEDRLTHQPIARALVDAMWDAVLTDNEGRFELSVPEGYANIQVRRPGYTAYPKNGPVRVIHVSESTPDLAFSLVPAANIYGHLTLQGDDDLEDVRFSLYRKNLMEGHAQWVPAGFANADTEGDFHFLQLEAPGEYIVCSMPSPSNVAGRGSHQQTGFPSVCFPGASSFGSAQPLQLSAGQQAQLEVTLERQPFYPVSVSVPGLGQNVNVQIHDRAGTVVQAGMRWSADRSAAEFQLPNGSYYAEARKWDQQKQSYGRADFSVANGPVSLALELLPLHPIPVNIRREFTETPNAGMTRIQLQDGSNPGLQLMFWPAGNVMNGNFIGGMRHVDGGGPDAFQMDATPGRYRARVYSYEGYVSSITSGGVDLASSPLAVGPGNSSAPIEITVRNDGGQITCAVTDSSATSGAPAANADSVDTATLYVIAIPQFPSAVPFAQAIAHAGRPAVLANLAPGEYRIAAFDSMPQFDLEDTQQVARITAKGKSVTVQPNGQASIEIELTHLDEEGAL